MDGGPWPGLLIESGTRSWEIIHGVANNRRITLLECFPKSSKMRLFAQVKSPDSQVVVAEMAVIGVHMACEDDELFASAEISIEDLESWADSSVLQTEIGVANEVLDRTAKISVKPVEIQSVEIANKKYLLRHNYSLPKWDSRKGETIASMTETVTITVEPINPFSLREARQEASLLQDLISLATHRAAGILWLQLEVSGSELQSPNGSVSPAQRANVLYSPIVIGEADAKATTANQMLFTCSLIPFPEMMERWHRVYHSLREATNMVLGLRYAPPRFIENNLLMAVGAAEVLHRGLNMDSRPFPIDEFCSMRDEMLSHVPVKYRGRFKAIIRNDPTLRDRLCALALRPDRDAVSLLVSDINCWARATTRARNAIAHQGKVSKQSMRALFAIVEVTKSIVLLNLLHELGVPPAEQRRIVQDNSTFERAAELSERWLKGGG